MAEISPQLINSIVQKVMLQLEQQGLVSDQPTSSVKNGIFEDIPSAITATEQAQKIWVQTPKETKARVIQALRQAMHQNAEEFARRAQEETGMGRVKCKIIKHHNAADATPGLEDLDTLSWSGDNGTTVEEYAPYGIIGAITPSTHPIPVLLNSTIIMIAPGNGVVFNVHPAAKKVSAYAMEIFNRAIQENGGPANLISMVREPTMETVSQLFHHPKISLIAATGGPALVKAAFESGKKVIAAGPGNPPVLVDETACLTSAAQYIIEGASFDNNILCIAEKEIFVVESVFDKFMNAMAEAGAVRLNAAQIDSLTQKAFQKNEKGQIWLSRTYIGKNASVLAQAAGLTISDEVVLLYGEAPFEHPFVQEEQMMPFIPVVRVKNAEEGIDLAAKAEHGFGHTAMIHSNHLTTITRYTQKLNTSIVVVNGPSLAGNGPKAGEGYFSHTIASPTGEGVCTPKNFARVRRLAIYKKLHIV
ncbi:aldehyde dehydrogenase EutE [candidate division KSB1 bacterium]|nr:aldehyde dehydrogenase EutE [candidate division KSB1 bacterium]